MPKTLLFFLLLFSFSIGAQNWMPFNPNDSVWQYKSQDLSYQSPSSSVYYIQSIVADSSYSSGNFQRIIFKKGYSHSAIEKLKAQNILVYKQKIKGKLVGDTAQIFTDSTLFSSIDPLGFRITFPHHYYSGMSWSFGNSSSKNLSAFVYQKSFENIPEFGFDSIAKFYLLVYNLNGTVDNSHPWSNVLLSVSKNNGIINMPDLTQLDMRLLFSKTNWVGESISKGENHILSSGDQYHYTKWVEDRSNLSSIIMEYHEYEVHINTVLISGNSKQILFQEYYQKRSYPGGPIISPVTVTSKSKTIQSNTLFQMKHSGNIDDTLLSGTSSSGGLALNYYYQANNAIAPYGLYTDNLIQYNDTVYGYNSLAQEQDFYMIGIAKGFKKYTSVGSGPVQSEQIIRYIKRGNQVWGSPLNLSTSIKRIDKYPTYSIYPNPAEQQLNIQTDLDFEMIEIQMLDGQLIKQIPFSKAIDVSDLPAGGYFLKLIGGEKTQVEKFMKSK